MLRYLQFAFNNWYQSAEQDIKSRQQTLWVFVEEREGGREAGRVVTTVTTTQPM
jgi:hypothetical protein